MTTFESIGFTAMAGCIIFAISLFSFGIAVRVRHVAIAPRCTARPPDVIYNPVAPPNSEQNRGNVWFGWIPFVMQLSYDVMLNGVAGTGTRANGLKGKMLYVNLDDIVLIRFHAVCFKVSLLTTVLALGVVLPLNVYSYDQCYTNKDLTCFKAEGKYGTNFTNYDRTTSANIPQLQEHSIGGIDDFFLESIWHDQRYWYLLASMYSISFCALIVYIYFCSLLKQEWVEMLALRRVYMLENDHHGRRDVELQSTIYYEDDDDDDDDSQLSLEGDSYHGKDIPTLQSRRMKKKMEKLKRKRKKFLAKRRDPWIPNPEQRDTVPNIELYSVLVAGLPKLPSEVIDKDDIETTIGFSKAQAIDWQLTVVSTFFNHCVPNQPGFSSSVAAVTILPDAPELARAWRKWYKAAVALRRLKFIRRLIADRRHYDIDFEDDEDEDEDDYYEDARTNAHKHSSSNSYQSEKNSRNYKTPPILPPALPPRTSVEEADFADDEFTTTASTVASSSASKVSSSKINGYDHDDRLHTIPAISTPDRLQSQDIRKQHNHTSKKLQLPPHVHYAQPTGNRRPAVPERVRTKKVNDYRGVFGNDENEEVETQLFQALNYGPEQIAVYSRELAQAAACCCPNGFCGEGRIRNTRIDDLIHLEEEAVKAVHNANQNLQYAQNLAANSILENNEHAPVSKSDANFKEQDLGVALNNKHRRASSYGDIRLSNNPVPPNSDILLPDDLDFEQKILAMAHNNSIGNPGIPLNIEAGNKHKKSKGSSIPKHINGAPHGHHKTKVVKSLESLEHSDRLITPPISNVDRKSIQAKYFHDEMYGENSAPSRLISSVSTGNAMTQKNKQSKSPQRVPKAPTFSLAGGAHSTIHSAHDPSDFSPKYGTIDAVTTNPHTPSRVPWQQNHPLYTERSASRISNITDQLEHSDYVVNSGNSVHTPGTTLGLQSGGRSVRFPHSGDSVSHADNASVTANSVSMRFSTRMTSDGRVSIMKRNPSLEDFNSIIDGAESVASSRFGYSVGNKSTDIMGNVDNFSPSDRVKVHRNGYDANSISGLRNRSTRSRSGLKNRQKSERWQQVAKITEDSSIVGNNPNFTHVNFDGVWLCPTLSELGKGFLKAIQSIKNWASRNTGKVVDELARETTFAVVTFTNRQAAVAARHSLADGRGSNRWLAVDGIPTPPLADSASCDLKTCRGCCRPLTISVNKKQQMLRICSCRILLAFMYIFYTIPITFASKILEPAEYFYKQFPSFKEKVEGTMAENFLLGIVQAFLFTLFFSLCPIIFKAIANSGSNATSVIDAETDAMKYFWYFMLVTSFTSQFLAEVALDVYDVGNLSGQFYVLLETIGKVLPTKISATWINWIILRTTVVLPTMYLLQFNTFLFMSLRWDCCARAVMGGGPGAQLPYRIYVDAAVVLLCVVALSFLSPIVAPCGLLYFLVCQPLWRRNCLFTYRPKYDGGGIRWPFLFNICTTTMFVGQFVLSMTFFFKGALGPAMSAMLPIIPTLVFRKSCINRFLPAYLDAGLLQTSLLDLWDSSEPTSSEKREKFRKFLVDGHKAAYIPVCIAGESTSILTAEPAVTVPLDHDTDNLSCDSASVASTKATPSVHSMMTTQPGATFSRSPYPQRTGTQYLQ